MSDTPDNTEETPEVEADVFDITTATEDQLRERASELRDKIATLEAGPRNLATVQAVTDLRTERNQMVQAVNQMKAVDAAGLVDDEITEIDDTAAATEVADAGETVDTEPTADESAPSPAETTVSASDPIPEVPDSPGDSPELVAAAEEVLAEARVASATDRPVAPATPAYTRPRAAYVAGAGQTEYAQGAELGDSEMARAWESMRTGLQPGPNGRARAVVANLRPYESESDMPIEILSAGNSIERNDALIDASVAAWRDKRNGQAPAAHTAAICDPLDIIREIPYGGETDSSFADRFPQRPISRLGFQFTRASAMSAASSGVAIWTEGDQSGVDVDDSGTWKPTVLIECSSPAEIKAQELTTSALVDTSTEMSSPERVAEFMHKLAVARARRREQYVLDLFDATASPYTLTGTFGAMASLTQAVHTVLPQLLYTERLDEAEYDLVLDPGFYDKLVIDIAVQCELSTEDALARIEREIGLSLVRLRDFETARATAPFQTPPTPGGGSAALTALPSANRARLVPAGAYIYGATGEQATGWQTDPQLARQNRMQAFSQEWLLLAKHGEHPAAFIDITSVSNGSRGGCVTPN